MKQCFDCFIVVSHGMQFSANIYLGDIKIARCPERLRTWACIHEVRRLSYYRHVGTIPI